MNRIYRLVWNEVLGVWVAVAENARGRGKRAARALSALALVAIGLLLPVLAAPPAPTQLPTGGQVVGGNATLNQSATSNGARLDINQSSQRGAIDWQSFNVGAQAQVNFNQPSGSAVTLNRVLDSQPSQIFGRITANGQVFLTNPNGVVFGPSASVDVGGLVATTHGISNADFMAGGNTFSRGGASGAVSNEGSLNAGLGGYIALLAPEVRNSGVIVANAGTVALAAGDVIELQFGSNNTLAGLRTTPSSIAALVDNRLAVRAPGGQIILSAQAVNQLQGGVVKNSGSLTATSLVNDGGVIRLVGDYVQLEAGSSVSANGTRGGTIDISAQRVLQSGSLEANGTSGGTINVKTSDQILQTTQSTTTADGTSGPGGKITLQAGKTLFSSGTLSAKGNTGGSIHALGETVVLAAANLNASGKTAGGTVLVGGDFQGKNPLIQNAQTVNVNPSTQIKADAQISGHGGKAIVWSDDQTTFYGSISAKGGAQGGNGGQIEVSGKQELVYGGVGDASAPLGIAGNLLLDPANIVISSAGSLPAYSFIDPNATTGGAFGANIIPLSTGNVVVSASQDTVGGVTTAGAVYLYNGLTGGLISALTGSTTADQVGSNGITALTNGNYVVSTPNWNNGTVVEAGAVTWGSGVTGVNGAVSSTNSLVGSSANNFVGQFVTALANGNYVTNSAVWDNGAVADVGAVTWGNGATGITGVVSAANSLVGSQAGDVIGVDAWGSGSGIIALTNGNYVVTSAYWNNGTVGDAGAVTWGNGTIGTTGAVSAANSLVGSQTNDKIGYDGVTALANGHYVVISSVWNNGVVSQAGAVTWGNGTTGITGVVSAANSLVGSTANDSVGSEGVTALTNGHYVAVSALWNGGFGAATWGNGATGTTGVVSGANSLVGSATTHRVGLDGVTALTNGNYVVDSSLWDNGGTSNVGAATWGDGATGTSGVVSAANSLVGSQLGDRIGFSGVAALANGNYVVRSQVWDNGTVTDAGAATWGNGTAGTSGVVSSTNSLVGSTASDRVGGNGLVTLTNGNYVVITPFWDNGTVVDAGAVTWGNGATGTSGVVSSANSLVGSAASDEVGHSSLAVGVTALANGNYVVVSPLWNSGAVNNAGAATWGNGATGITGVLSSTNSLVGSVANDSVGKNGVTALANGNYVVGSQSWRNGAVTQAGAATWGNGSTGTTGTISAANSLLGTVASQWLGVKVVEDTVNNTFVVGDTLGLTVQAGFADPNLITTTRGGSSTLTITPSLITNILNTGTAVTLQATNNITVSNVITASGSGALTMQAGGSITVNAAISTVGVLTLQATGGSSDITLNAAVSSAAVGDSVVLSAGRNFINTAGAGAIDPGAGRFLVYSTNPAADTRNGLVYDFKQYNTAYGSPVLGSGDGFIYTLAPTITAGLTGSVSKGYDGALTATLTGANYSSTSGAVDGDTVTLNNPGSGTFDTKNAGVTKTVSVNGLAIASASNGAATVYGYQLASTTASAAIGTITPKALTVTGMSATNRVYDGSLSAALTGGALSGLVGTELLNFSGQSGAFGDKNVGTAKGVTVSGITLADAGAGATAGLASNYTVSNPLGLTADITPKALTVSGMSATDRAYDGSTSAALTGGALSGLIGTELLNFSGQSGAFADKNVGTAKGVTVSGITLADAGAGGTAGLASNYTVSNPLGLTADITPKALTVAGMSATDRAYDGSTGASLTGGALTGLVGTELLSFSGQSGVFGDKDVGTAKGVTVSGITLADAGAGATAGLATNYTVSNPLGLTADITPKALTVTGMSATDRVYDGGTSAALTGGALTGLVGTELLSFSGQSGAFGDKNVGTAKGVTVSGITLADAGAGATAGLASNYTVSNPLGLTADITPKALTVTGMSATDHVYDGTTSAALTGGTLTGLIGTELLSFSGQSGAFGDKNVGTAKGVTVTGITLADAGAGATAGLASNYTVSNPLGLTADITPRTLTVGATGVSRVYDGTTVATVTLGDDRVAGDVLTLLNGSASFNDKNVGVGKTVTVTGISVGGADAGNYSANASTATTADITARTLTVAATGSSRVYDGTTVATVTLGDNRVAGDVLLLSNSAAHFNDENVGTGKTIHVLGIGAAGADAGNYILSNATATTVADILPVGTVILPVGPPPSVPVSNVNPGAPLVSSPPTATVDPSFGLPPVGNVGANPVGGAPNANTNTPATNAPSADAQSTQSRLNPSVHGGNTRRGFNPLPLLFDAYGRPHSLDQLVQRFDQSTSHAFQFAANQSVEEMARSFLQSPLFGLNAGGQGAVDAIGAIGANTEQALLASMSEVWSQLDALKQKAERHLSDRQQITLGVTAGALIVSAGTMIWLLAGGSLAFLSLAFMPLWRGFDPLPVLDKKKEKLADRSSKEAVASEKRLRALMSGANLPHQTA